MLIDWFTVLAQVLNFLILIGLLKHFLYKPVRAAIDAREKKVAKEIADADAREAHSQQENEAFTKKNAEFDQQRAGLLVRAIDDAKKESGRLSEEARLAAVASAAEREESWKAEELSSRDSVRLRIQQEVLAIARRALTDLSGKTLEESVIDLFVRRLGGMADDAKQKLRSAFTASSGPAVIRSAFDLTPLQKSAVEKEVKNLTNPTTEIRYETRSDLIAGIELNAGGQQIGWSISDYLKAIEKGVADLKPKGVAL